MTPIQEDLREKFAALKPDQRIDLVDKNSSLIFYINEKNDKNGALQTLSKIQTLVQNEKYMDQWPDLMFMVGKITTNYYQKFTGIYALPKIIDLFRLKANEKELKDIVEIRKNNLESPPIVFPLPPEIICYILNYLSINTLSSFVGVNRTAKNVVDTHCMSLALNKGFNDNEDYLLARKYVHYINGIVPNLYYNGFINENCIVFSNNNEIDVKKTLNDWKAKQLKPSDYLNLPRISKNLSRLLESPWLKNETRSQLRKKRDATLRILLKWGLDPNFLGQDGSTLLHHSKSSYEVASLLKKKANVNVINSAGLTPLCCPRNLFDLDTVRLLVACGADPDYQNPANGNTPFHYLFKEYSDREGNHPSFAQRDKILKVLLKYSKHKNPLNQFNFKIENPWSLRGFWKE